MDATPYLTEQQVAEHLGVTARTLRRWRTLPDPPPHHRVGGLIRYRVEEVDAWVRSGAAAQLTARGRGEQA